MQELMLASSTSRRGATDSKRFAHSAGPLTLRVQALPVSSFVCAKTVSKWCPKRAKMEPAAKVMHSKLQNGTKLRQGVVFPDLPRPFGASRGPIGSPKIHQESTFCSEMHSKRVFFADFCADNRFTRFFSRFCINFSRKNNQNLMRK